MKLGVIIEQIRLELVLSQEGLIRKLLVGFTSVNRWENGRAKPNPITRHVLYYSSVKLEISNKK